MTVTVKMSRKNQIVVPREARDALGLNAGDRLVVTARPDGVIEMERQPRDPVEELAGILGEAAAGRQGRSGLWEELGHE